MKRVRSLTKSMEVMEGADNKDDGVLAPGDIKSQDESRTSWNY